MVERAAQIAHALAADLAAHFLRAPAERRHEEAPRLEVARDRERRHRGDELEGVAA